MFTTLRRNKVSVLIVVILFIALVFAREKTIAYVQAHTYSQGKGSVGALPELWAYGLAMITALTELIFLSSRHFLFRVLCLLATLANVLYVAFLVFVAVSFGAPDYHRVGISIHDYLFAFPFLCDVVFAVLFFLKR